MMAVISRAAADPSVDIDKMERLLSMQERMVARQAESEFAAALAIMQTELPSVGERGGIRDKSNRIQSTYALWEDINAAIKPVLSRHGFALSFRIDCSNGIAVTGVLSHRCGHSESTTINLPSDTTGSKNAVQAVASSVSYGKRYTAGALLNITSHGEDDDAFQAAPLELNEVQVAAITDLATEVGADLPNFLAYLASVAKRRISTINEIPQVMYEEAKALLEQKRRASALMPKAKTAPAASEDEKSVEGKDPGAKPEEHAPVEAPKHTHTDGKTNVAGQCVTAGMLNVVRAKLNVSGKSEADLIAQFGVDALEKLPMARINDVLKAASNG